MDLRERGGLGEGWKKWREGARGSSGWDVIKSAMLGWCKCISKMSLIKNQNCFWY